jgi:hypothetical protein
MNPTAKQLEMLRVNNVAELCIVYLIEIKNYEPNAAANEVKATLIAATDFIRAGMIDEVVNTLKIKYIDTLPMYGKSQIISSLVN